MRTVFGRCITAEILLTSTLLIYLNYYNRKVERRRVCASDPPGIRAWQFDSRSRSPTLSPVTCHSIIVKLFEAVTDPHCGVKYGDVALRNVIICGSDSNLNNSPHSCLFLRLQHLDRYPHNMWVATRFKVSNSLLSIFKTSEIVG
jgi:hypothetical protein